MSEDRGTYVVTGGSGFIGTNLISELEKTGARIVNLDVEAPNERRHAVHWTQCDVMDFDKLGAIFAEKRPTHLIHLAARTDIDGETLRDYKVNVQGTLNVLNAIKRVGTVKRLIVTSTQFVHQFQGNPKHDEDFAPYTVYGESKVETEKLTRAAGLECIWSIVRPTNIWGPWHPRYPHEFWRVVAERKYLHPGGDKVRRSYGYVGNVVWQMMRMLDAPAANVSGKVFYVGDRPVDLLDWVNGFSTKQTGRKVMVVPRACVRLLGFVGDMCKAVNVGFPITTSRYRSMTTDNVADMEKTFDVLGEPPYSLEAGIAETVEWMKEYHPKLIQI
jgi:nucleoside-diphosphate-sugar epimerase